MICDLPLTLNLALTLNLGLTDLKCAATRWMSEVTSMSADQESARVSFLEKGAKARMSSCAIAVAVLVDSDVAVICVTRAYLDNGFVLVP